MPIASNFSCTIADFCVPLLNGGSVACAIDGFHGEERVLDFEVAARGEGFVGLDEDLGGVLEAGEEHAAVDEVEFLAEHPLFMVRGVNILYNENVA